MTKKLTDKERNPSVDKLTQPVPMTFLPDKYPECGSKSIVLVVYGEPSAELAHKADHGEVYLGGCIMYTDAPNPKWKCLNCMNEFA